MMLVLVSFFLTSISTLVSHGYSVTQEEAIEISRNSGVVPSLLSDAEWYTLEVHYLNRTEGNVWHIAWYIRPKGAPSAYCVCVVHSIDEETGWILEESLCAFR